MRKLNMGVLVTGVAALAVLLIIPACQNKNIKYDKYPLQPGSVVTYDKHRYNYDYSPRIYPCSLLKHIDSLYFVKDTVTLNTVLDTAVIINYGISVVDTTRRYNPNQFLRPLSENAIVELDSAKGRYVAADNYPNPFSLPPGFPFSVERDSDLVTIFITNENRSFTNICLNAKFSIGHYFLNMWDLDTCQTSLLNGYHIVDIRIGEKRQWRQFVLLR
jgi:hypothetical protein